MEIAFEELIGSEVRYRHRGATGHGSTWYTAVIYGCAMMQNGEWSFLVEEKKDGSLNALTTGRHHIEIVYESAPATEVLEELEDADLGTELPPGPAEPA